MERSSTRLDLAVLFAYMKAQELTLRYSDGKLPKGEIIWYKDPKILKWIEKLKIKYIDEFCIVWHWFDYSPSKLKQLHKQGKQVFLDINLYDIPRTIKATIKSAKRVGLDYISINPTGKK